MIHVINYGGGVNSTAMTLLLLQQQKPIDYIIFADTGEEKPETYAFMEIFSEYLQNEYSFPIIIVRRKNHPQTLSEYCRQFVILPSFHWRFCTTQFKIQPIRQFLTSMPANPKSFGQYFAFDADEWGRVKKPRWSDTTHFHPLIDADLTRTDCECIIKQHGLPVPPKSSCYFCPFTKPQDLAALAGKHPDLIEKMKALEEYVNQPTRSTRQKPFRFFQNYTVQQWIDIGLSRLEAKKLQLWLFDARRPCVCLD